MLCDRSEVVKYYDSRLTLYSDGKLVIRDYDSAIQKYDSGIEDYVSDDIYSGAIGIFGRLLSRN